MIHAVISDVRWQDSGLAQRFRPEEFISPEHANTWRAIQELLRRGEPVDPLEVAWEAESFANDPNQVLPAIDHQALPAAVLARMAEPPSTDVRRAISTVARSAMSQHAQLAQREIAQVTNDRRADVLGTLDTVTKISGTLVEHAERLVGDDRTTRSTITRGLAGEPPTPAPHVVGTASTRPRAR
jgi:replicative DNA helicase